MIDGQTACTTQPVCLLTAFSAESGHVTGSAIVELVGILSSHPSDPGSSPIPYGTERGAIRYRTVRYRTVTYGTAW